MVKGSMFPDRGLEVFAIRSRFDLEEKRARLARSTGSESSATPCKMSDSSFVEHPCTMLIQLLVAGFSLEVLYPRIQVNIAGSYATLFTLSIRTIAVRAPH